MGYRENPLRKPKQFTCPVCQGSLSGDPKLEDYVYCPVCNVSFKISIDYGQTDEEYCDLHPDRSFAGDVEAQILGELPDGLSDDKSQP